MAPDQLLEQKQAEKKEVKGYFETTGFDRWNRIYSDSDDVNKVQRNIRIGHQKTVDEVLAWIKESGELSQASFCDAGCGVGSLSLPLAAMGAGSISASDISEAMAQEAERRAREAGLDMAKLNFFASDTGYFEVDGYSGVQPELTMKVGETYVFDQTDETNW